MGKIVLLSKNVSELIAAGEVIERPASIVKELVENSIDAKAQNITVEIQGGGISFLRVTDDGIGFLKEDIKTAFLRHATSKVKDEEDLLKIQTLGFRGEALASICAVSKTELISKSQDENEGSHIVLHGGEEVSFNQVNCQKGSTIIVRDLFYNIPARLKFLKSTISEGLNISQIIDKLAIANPHISFKLIINNKIKLHTPGTGVLLDAIKIVCGEEFGNELIPIEYTYNNLCVYGYITKNSYGRPTRNMQTFFVNSRYVKPKSAIIALEEAYRNTIMIGKFPGCVIDFKIPYDMIDVNVHPAKIEIRFTDEKSIFELIYFGVKTALKKHNMLDEGGKETEIVLTSVSEKTKGEQVTFVEKEINYYPIDKVNESNQENSKDVVKPYQIVSYEDNLMNLENSSKVNDNTFVADKTNGKSEDNDCNISSVKQVNENINNNSLQNDGYNDEKENYINNTQANIIDLENNLFDSSDISKKTSFLIKNKNSEFKYIGELFKTYMIIEVGNDIITIDKHAAHEKIIYDRLIEENSTGFDKQVLLSPISVAMTKTEFIVLFENQDKIVQLGFKFVEYNNHSILITKVPSILTEYEISDVFLDLLERLSVNEVVLLPEVIEQLFHSMACKRAIKANDDNDIVELIELAKKVYYDNEIRFCPHGRPIVVVEKKVDFDKKFGRV